MKNKNHKWKITDDVVAFYLFKSGLNKEIEYTSKKTWN
jgi:hypothetical protein